MLLTSLTYLIKAGYYICTLIIVGASLHYALDIKRLSFRTVISLGVGCIAFLTGRLLSAHAQLVGSIKGFYSLEMYDWVWIANQEMVLYVLAGLTLLLFGYGYKHKGISLIGSALLVYSYGTTGHTIALENPFLAPYIVCFHVLIASYWIVAPINLWPYRQSPENVLVQTEKFSALAVWAIPLLFVSGIWLLYQITGSITATYTSAYGQILILKLIGALGLLSIGAVNKTLITEKLKRREPSGITWLKLTLIMEAALFLIVIGMISAATVFIGPKH